MRSNHLVALQRDVDWLTTSFSLDDAQVHRYHLTVNATDNPTSDPRTGVIAVKANKEMRHIKVVQLGAVAEDPTDTQMTALKIAREMGLGINIGNTLEAIGGETAWGAAQSRSSNTGIRVNLRIILKKRMRVYEN